ncbi:hypothetical protein DPMN_039690 [Dreissena polymorpha]|uniref:Uncharacterized protein n=1 Tax=Dreissena polymorpha TaxID=45954 RepID=A0A9D4CVQ7_DREPO|nr:hypothetical protein DPMN_039690 [Dreissena polymorpha]
MDIPLPKRATCSGARKIDTISHHSKVMIRNILNRLKRKAEARLQKSRLDMQS